MNVEECTALLARIQVLDNRQVDQLTIEAWTPLMAQVDYAAAVEVVNHHFRTSTAYLQPAHVVQGVHRLRAVTMSPSAPSSCADGNHRWFPDGTCLHCVERRDG